MRGLLTILWHGPVDAERVVAHGRRRDGRPARPGRRALPRPRRCSSPTQGIGTMRVGYRKPNDLVRCVHDVAAAADLASRAVRAGSSPSATRSAARSRSRPAWCSASTARASSRSPRSRPDARTRARCATTSRCCCSTATATRSSPRRVRGGADAHRSRRPRDPPGAGHLLTEAADQLRRRLGDWIPVAAGVEARPRCADGVRDATPASRPTAISQSRTSSERTTAGASSAPAAIAVGADRRGDGEARSAARSGTARRGPRSVAMIRRPRGQVAVQSTARRAGSAGQQPVEPNDRVTRGPNVRSRRRSARSTVRPARDCLAAARSSRPALHEPAPRRSRRRAVSRATRGVGSPRTVSGEQSTRRRRRLRRTSRATNGSSRRGQNSSATTALTVVPMHDVLQPGESGVPTLRLHEIEQRDDHHRERRLAGTEAARPAGDTRARPRRAPARRTSAGRSSPMTASDQRRHAEPEPGPHGRGRDALWPVAERARAQDGQRAERRPRSRGRRSASRASEHRRRQRDPGPQRIAEPDRRRHRVHAEEPVEAVAHAPRSDASGTSASALPHRESRGRRRNAMFRAMTSACHAPDPGDEARIDAVEHCGGWLVGCHRRVRCGRTPRCTQLVAPPGRRLQRVDRHLAAQHRGDGVQDGRTPARPPARISALNGTERPSSSDTSRSARRAGPAGQDLTPRHVGRAGSGRAQRHQRRGPQGFARTSGRVRADPPAMRRSAASTVQSQDPASSPATAAATMPSTRTDERRGRTTSDGQRGRDQRDGPAEHAAGIASAGPERGRPGRTRGSAGSPPPPIVGRGSR